MPVYDVSLPKTGDSPGDTPKLALFIGGGIRALHLIYGSYGPSESMSQTACRSVRQF